MRSFLRCCTIFAVFAVPGIAGSVGDLPTPSDRFALGMQASDLELEYFGFDPSVFFFFTGNTSYLNNGQNELDIIAAALNPAGVTSLEGIVTHEVTFTIDDYGAISQISGLSYPAVSSSSINATNLSAPEPATFPLLAGGLSLLLLGYVLHRTSRRSRI